MNRLIVAGFSTVVMVRYWPTWAKHLVIHSTAGDDPNRKFVNHAWL